MAPRSLSASTRHPSSEHRSGDDQGEISTRLRSQFVFTSMLAGSVWGLRQGYAPFDITTAVWLIVLVVVLLMIIAPWPQRDAYW
jgi:hypothetical protein